jgi:hypothetical protein
MNLYLSLKDGIGVPFTINIPIRRIADLLCTAFEGGVGYWCRIVGYEDPENPVKIIDEDRITKYTDYPLCGGAVYCEIDDTSPIEQKRLDGVSIVEGLKIMSEKYQRHFANFISENEDAETGDVFLQCCLLGEVVYG